MSKAASSRADDKTNELKHLNRSMLRPGFVWNKEAKRMEEEKRITDRHIDETSQRAKAKLDVQQTQQVRALVRSRGMIRSLTIPLPTSPAAS